jgi:hypothetical protein
MNRRRVGLGVLVGAALGLAVFLLGRPATVGLDPVMAATFVLFGAFLAFLVAAGPWVREHTTIPYRDEVPPPGWRGGRVGPVRR